MVIDFSPDIGNVRSRTDHTYVGYLAICRQRIKWEKFSLCPRIVFADQILLDSMPRCCVVDKVIACVYSMHKGRNSLTQSSVDNGGYLIVGEQVLQRQRAIKGVPYGHAIGIDLREVEIMPFENRSGGKHGSACGHRVGDVFVFE